VIIRDASGNPILQGQTTVDGDPVKGTVEPIIVVLKAVPVFSELILITLSAVGAGGTPSSNPMILSFLNGGVAIDHLGNTVPATSITNNAVEIFPVGMPSVTFTVKDEEGRIGIATQVS